ncbi:putative F-box domain, galactose oxidase/kelch, beta-propeller, F-box associated interaction [Medicago truncatula]|uniref:F-box and associated interaction domain protein n=1 Tax=Medicago truncatula TaxID=3880 RepID=G7ISR3_MEDTR|nr:F-box protein CPR1 [Medicago truncatula]AES64645.1 F-box and associated interaction domain protein [Medicago truncatula]RHN72749.1 putative F-box domain, galactose oxidase/kelch, beta-propeller, F-box associated interaction [Medicago truncatula]
MAAELPPEILTEILSRLPVISLLRFRSTSKSFKSLIDSNKFINLHLRNSPNQSLILRFKFDIYQIKIDDDFSDPDTSMLLFPHNHPFTGNSTNIDPFKGNNTITLIGSCNGLLAMSHGVIAFTHPNAPNEITIWNPNTRKHRIIPFLPLPIPNILQSDNPNRGCLCVHGFGFDSVSGDYKLLRISNLLDLQNPFYDPHVRLFSLKTNSWKVIPNLPYSLYYALTMGVFVENSSSLHWVATRKVQLFQPDLILAFNLTLETFNEVPLPDEIEEEVNSKSFKIRVAALGGCLCMIVDYKDTKIDVWVMKEYGCRESWCKLFTVVKSSFDLPLQSLRLLGYSSDRKKVLLRVDVENLFWYDLESKQVSYVQEILNLDDTMICVGSLVPPYFPVDNRRKQENPTSESEKRDDFLSGGFKLRL